MDHIHILVQSTCIEADEYAREVAAEFRKYGRDAFSVQHNLALVGPDTVGITIEVTGDDAENRMIPLGGGKVLRMFMDFSSIPRKVQRYSATNEIVDKLQWAIGNCRNCVVETDTPREPDEHGNIFVGVQS